MNISATYRVEYDNWRKYCPHHDFETSRLRVASMFGEDVANLITLPGFRKISTWIGSVRVTITNVDRPEDPQRPYDHHIPLPIDLGIYLRRIVDPVSTVATNVRHICERHSPDGFEFGYNGSGPADLALNILQNVLEVEGYQGEMVSDDRSDIDGDCFVVALEHYQEFKEQFIATAPRNSYSVIPYKRVIGWLEERICFTYEQEDDYE